MSKPMYDLELCEAAGTLVERLGSFHISDEDGNEFWPSVCVEAATFIAAACEGWPAAIAENLALRAALAEEAAANVVMATKIAELIAERDAALAEVARLREALRECRQAVGHHNEEPRRNVRDVVDRALAKEQDNE